jgi:hypothetical protein
VRHAARAIAVTAVLAVLAGACGDEPATEDPLGTPGEQDGGLDGTVDGTDADQPVDGGDGGTGSGEVDLDAAAEAAVNDLAASQGVDPSAVEVVTAEEVTWPDGALGCPEPDQMYTQALVPGYRIVLEVDGTEVHYHGAEGAEPMRCDDPQPPVDD